MRFNIDCGCKKENNLLLYIRVIVGEGLISVDRGIHKKGERPNE